MKLQLDSQIDGVDTTVAQLKAQLDDAEWQLSKTTVNAPGDGYVTLSALSEGDRVSPDKTVMSFLLAGDDHIIAVLPQNGLQAVEVGSKAGLVFANDPGRVHYTKVLAVGRGVGQGQLATTGTLARVGGVGLTSEFPVELEVPADIDKRKLPAGLSGTVTVFSANAGPIGPLAAIMLWVNAYLAYL